MCVRGRAQGSQIRGGCVNEAARKRRTSEKRENNARKKKKKTKPARASSSSTVCVFFVCRRHESVVRDFSSCFGWMACHTCSCSAHC